MRSVMSSDEMIVDQRGTKNMSQEIFIPFSSQHQQKESSFFSLRLCGKKIRRVEMQNI